MTMMTEVRSNQRVYNEYHEDTNLTKQLNLELNTKDKEPKDEDQGQKKNIFFANENDDSPLFVFHRTND